MHKNEIDYGIWDTPNEEDILQMAHVITQYTRFIHPDIVKIIVEDNEKMFPIWKPMLENFGVITDTYMWDKGTCLFPGIRRHEGASEIANKRTKSLDLDNENAIYLDDNDYPKHLWSFILFGKQFSKKGPIGYQLAHILDHKKNNNRLGSELGLDSDIILPGLFTAPTNTCYVPIELMKPTDGNEKLRNLLFLKAKDLYRDVNILPNQYISRINNDSPKWDIKNFKWAEPVGNINHVEAFLAYRRKKMGDLFKKKFELQSIDSNINNGLIMEKDSI